MKVLETERLILRTWVRATNFEYPKKMPNPLHWLGIF